MSGWRPRVARLVQDNRIVRLTQSAFTLVRDLLAVVSCGLVGSACSVIVRKTPDPVITTSAEEVATSGSGREWTQLSGRAMELRGRLARCCDKGGDIKTCVTTPSKPVLTEVANTCIRTCHRRRPGYLQQGQIAMVAAIKRGPGLSDPRLSADGRKPPPESDAMFSKAQERAQYHGWQKTRGRLRKSSPSATNPLLRC